MTEANRIRFKRVGHSAATAVARRESPFLVVNPLRANVDS